jgi:hypothetical protein
MWPKRLALGVLLLGTVGVAFADQGHVSVWNAGSVDAPAWTGPCSRDSPRPDRTLLAGCSRVRGRVLVVRHKAVGQGRVETHVAVLAHFDLILVKLELGTLSPRTGEMITAVGPLVRARIGLREVQAFELAAS